MKDRFIGSAGNANMREALLRQSPVQGNVDVATAFAEAATLHEFALKNPLIFLPPALREYPMMVAVNSTFDRLGQSDGSSGGLG